MLSMARSAAQRVVLASTGAAARSTVPRAAAVCCYDGALAGSSVGSTSVGATRGVMTKIRRKRIRKKRAREIRALIKYAERYDPMRQCVRSVYATLKHMGWEFTQNHFITEGCHTMFALPDQMIAIEVVSPEEYAEPPAANQPPISMAQVMTTAEIADARTSHNIPNTVTEFVHRSLIDPPALNEETQAKHDVIVAKGWDLMVVHQPDWATCLEHPRQKLARYDYIIQRAIRLRSGLSAPPPLEDAESDDEFA